jgi:hypothetical protein
MKTVNINVTVDAPMPQAEDRILDRVDRRLRSVGFTGRHLDSALVYRPKFYRPSLGLAGPPSPE